MFADPLAANNDVSGGSPTVENYVLTSMGPNGSTRVFPTATTGYPKVCRISHTTVGKGKSQRVRHLVRLEAYQIVDGVEDTSLPPFAVYAVADVPVGVTSDQKSNMANRFVGLIRGASGDAANATNRGVFWDKWLNGES